MASVMDNMSVDSYRDIYWISFNEIQGGKVARNESASVIYIPIYE